MHYLRLSSAGRGASSGVPRRLNAGTQIHPAPADTSVWIQFFRSGG